MRKPYVPTSGDDALAGGGPPGRPGYFMIFNIDGKVLADSS
jgi:hypothetical protein